MNEISEKQLEANRENAQKGGVKSEEGKNVSKYNAMKHGILKEIVSNYERDFYEDIMKRLNDQFSPVGVLEKLLVDRIGICYLRLFRVAKSENEYMKSILDPRKVTVRDTMDFPSYTETIVDNEGYTPKVGEGAIEKLSTTYLRYEIAIENRLYKALHELQRVQATRNGGLIPPPAVLDIDMSGDGEMGSFRKKEE